MSKKETQRVALEGISNWIEFDEDDIRGIQVSPYPRATVSNLAFISQVGLVSRYGEHLTLFDFENGLRDSLLGNIPYCESIDEQLDHISPSGKLTEGVKPSRKVKRILGTLWSNFGSGRVSASYPFSQYIMGVALYLFHKEKGHMPEEGVLRSVRNKTDLVRDGVERVRVVSGMISTDLGNVEEFDL